MKKNLKRILIKFFAFVAIMSFACNPVLILAKTASVASEFAPNAGWLPVAGDWDGDGTATIGLYDPKTSIFYLRNSNTTGVADITFGYGAPNAGWLPVAGDWDKNKTASIGLYNPLTSVFTLRNSNTTGIADITFGYGAPNAGWLPVAGDWDGDGTATIALYDSLSSTFYLRNSNTSGYADATFSYGVEDAGWLPVAGDWDGDGTATIGLYDSTASIFMLKNQNTSGVADITFGYGAPNAGWLPVAGDWDGDGTATIGLYDPKTSIFYLRNSNTTGVADITFGYGAPFEPLIPGNLILNPSMESGSSAPDNWHGEFWGSNNVIFSYPTTGHTGNGSSIATPSYTDGDAKWRFDDVKVVPSQQYVFSDFYKSTIKTTVTLRFTLNDGTFLYADMGYPEPSTDWSQFSGSFVAPLNAVSVTVFHLINSAGYLSVDDFFLAGASPGTAFPQGMISINFDDAWTSAYQNAFPVLDVFGIKATEYAISGAIGDTANGYMTQGQLLDLQNRGHEIEAHSKTHLDLTTLTQAQMTDEILGSKQALEAMGFKTITSFDYPYGAYNSAVTQTVKNAGYLGARTADNYEQDIGDNYASQDPYLLKTQVVVSTTPISIIQQWINNAIVSKTWLILVFHKVDNSGEQYSYTPMQFSQVVDYINQTKIKFITMTEGLGLLAN